ncbi:protein NDNF-like isoform X2 [Sipha flava]|nr:protein NDNF-like isoform X2 [Sipha flava]XP_025412477.1 protein NDNF-like isoform X2 [Sipha flava]
MMIMRLWLAVLIAELLTVVATKSPIDDLLPHSRTIPNTTLNLDLIPQDIPSERLVTKFKTVFHFLIHQDTDQNLCVTVSPNKTRINWKLKFIPNKYKQKIILGNNKSSNLGVELVEYTGVSTPVTYDHQATRGLYEITAQTIDVESNITFYVTLRPNSLIRKFDIPPNKLTVKSNGQRVSLKWNPSHIDQHFTQYSLVISTSNIYSTFLEAKHQLEEKLKRNVTHKSDKTDYRLEIHHLGFHTNYTLTDLIYDRTYYFTVFALNEMRVYTQYASTTFKYQKPKPFALKDAKPRIENLRAHSGKASFRYKVGNRSREPGAEPNKLFWYVMTCDGVVNVEIRCRKTLLVKKRVFGYEKIVLDNTKYGERYVLKVETVSLDETQRVKSIEVMATVRPRMFPMPDMPSDLRIQQYVKPDDCHSVTIGWLPAKSNEDLQYCVYLQNDIPNNSVDFSAKQDQCGLSYGRNWRGNYQRYRCWYTGEKECVYMLASVEKVLKLKSSTTYVIRVTVTKPRGRTLSYDLLKLDTNSCGLN